MNILALETSTRLASLAAVADERVLAEISLPLDRRTTESLAPALQQLVQQYGWNVTEIGLIAVASGPGSFTGLRIGVTTAKTMAYACQAPLVAVDTLRVIASQADTAHELVCPILDAHRRQAFVAVYRRAASGEMVCDRPSCIVPVDRLATELPMDAVLTGPLLRHLAPDFCGGRLLTQPEEWFPRASTVARLARLDHLGGHEDDLWSLVPNYLRPSAAEEKAGG